MSDSSNLVCRGSWALGTACGKCQRCLASKPPSLSPSVPQFNPVQQIDAWIAPADLYVAISKLAEMHPASKHVCWDMLMLAHALPRTVGGGK